MSNTVKPMFFVQWRGGVPADVYISGWPALSQHMRRSPSYLRQTVRSGATAEWTMTNPETGNEDIVSVTCTAAGKAGRPAAYCYLVTKDGVATRYDRLSTVADLVGLSPLTLKHYLQVLSGAALHRKDGYVIQQVRRTDS